MLLFRNRIYIKNNGDKLEDNTNQTNRELQEATEELNQISGALSGMTETMQETSESVTEIEEAAVSIKQMSEELYQKTMEVIEVETASLSDVAEVSDKIYGKMQNASSNSEINEEIIGELGNMLDKFIV